MCWIPNRGIYEVKLLHCSGMKVTSQILVSVLNADPGHFRSVAARRDTQVYTLQSVG